MVHTRLRFCRAPRRAPGRLAITIAGLLQTQSMRTGAINPAPDDDLHRRWSSASCRSRRHLREPSARCILHHGQTTLADTPPSVSSLRASVRRGGSKRCGGWSCLKTLRLPRRSVDRSGVGAVPARPAMLPSRPLGVGHCCGGSGTAFVCTGFLNIAIRYASLELWGKPSHRTTSSERGLPNASPFASVSRGCADLRGRM